MRTEEPHGRRGQEPAEPEVQEPVEGSGDEAPAEEAEKPRRRWGQELPEPELEEEEPVEPEEPPKMRIGVLISGSGTNLQAIMDACELGDLYAEIAVVVSNHEAAYGLERARRGGVPAVYIDRARFDTFRKYNEELLRVLSEYEVDVVAMAGYMRLLGRNILDAYPMRVLNIHPALLPSFPGASGIHDAFDYGVKVTGVTVHFANERFDAGAIILQEAVRIEEDDTVETVEAKIHEVEHRLYPAALKLLSEFRLGVEGRRVHILPAP